MSSRWLEKQKELEDQEASIANIGLVFTEPVQPVRPTPPANLYTWLQDDTIPGVTRKLGISRADLLEHNGIDDPDSIKPGDVLHLPMAIPESDIKAPLIEVLPKAVPMHVIKPGGCKKWTFGNMTGWDDAKSAGFFPLGSNLTIVAIAHVPFTDKDGKDVEAAYYMDANALGDYVTTGRVRWAVGYIWSDLEEGHVDKIKAPAPVAQRALGKQRAEAVAKKLAGKTQPEEGFDQSFIQRRLADILRDGQDTFKYSRQVLEHPVACTAHIPEDVGELDQSTRRRFVVIHDYDTRRPDRRLYHNQEVTISETFEYDGVLLGRPEKAANNGIWYGIDQSLLQSDVELYNTQSDASTRAEEGRQLTWSERYIWVPLAKLSSHWQKKNK